MIYHPLFMTTLLMMVMLWYAPDLIGKMDNKIRWTLVGLFSILTVVLPLISIFLLKLTSNISGFTLENRGERLWPLIFTSVYYGATAYWLTYKLHVSTAMIAIIIGIFLTILLVTIITIFWKISIHSAGAWGGVGIFLAILQKSAESQLLWPLLAAVLMAGLIGTSRLCK